jgi:hypothetical protein
MPRRLIFWSVAAAAILAAAWQVWVLRWTCDDAFISFRYAQHFADGHGLVFNLDPSEAPVEGYTNFAWTMWLALGVAFGCRDYTLELWGIVSGLVCHAGTVALLAAIAWRASGGRALLPIAACAFAAIHHAASLAPAGLETALFTLLVTAMLRHCFLLRCVRAAWLLGFLGVVTAMTRPDGAVLCVVAGGFVLFDAWRRRSGQLLLGYVLPFVLVFVPYLLWRRAYYGYWLPNTFYAKSGPGSYAAQGWRYVVDFFACYWPLPLALLPIATFLVRRPDPLAGISAWLGRRPWLVIAAFVGAYLAFVVYVGGDFMFGRFLIPILPTLLLAFDFACLRWRPLWLQPVLAVFLVVGLSLRREPPNLADYTLDVSDNRVITMVEILPGLPLLDYARDCCTYLREVFDGLPIRMGIAGAHAAIAYGSRVPVAVETAAGLTDAWIARLAVPPGGKRGHDRQWPLYPDYLIRRRLHFMLELSYAEKRPWQHIFFPTPAIALPMRIVTWDRELMRELKRRDPNIQFTDFEPFLDQYIATLSQKNKADVAADFAAFESYYFRWYADPARRQAFDDFLR